MTRRSTMHELKVTVVFFDEMTPDEADRYIERALGSIDEIAHAEVARVTKRQKSSRRSA